MSGHPCNIGLSSLEMQSGDMLLDSSKKPFPTSVCALCGVAVVSHLKTAAAVPLSPREDRKAVMRQPGDSTALKCSMMKARLAGSTGCWKYSCQLATVFTADLPNAAAGNTQFHLKSCLCACVGVHIMQCYNMHHLCVVCSQVQHTNRIC